MKNNKNYTIRFRIWIDETTGPYLGIGRILLLENIKTTGSITQAARKLKMSYRKAWQLVEDMNRRAQKPLVEKTLGGAGGGGASLTQQGIQAIISFYELEQKTLNYIKEESSKIKF